MTQQLKSVKWFSGEEWTEMRRKPGWRSEMERLIVIRLEDFAAESGLMLITEPTIETRFDELRGEVIISAEALAEDVGI